MNLELLELIIYPNICNKTCFLCFHRHKELNDIYTKITIVKGHLDLTVSVFQMLSHFFSIQETSMQGVCDKCTNIIISFYIVIQKHNLMKENIMKIMHKLEKELLNLKEVDKKCYLNIHATDDPTCINDIPTSSRKFSKMDVQECLKCDMKLESKDQLQEHTKIVHRTTNEAVICHICGKSCKTPNSLKGHLNCHKEKQCPYCSKLLKTHSHYKIHVQNHVSCSKRKRNQTSYNCHNCSFVSLNKGSLEAHINKAHLGLRPHVCLVCHKGFFKKSNLTEHSRIHGKVKTETCEICGDNFVSRKTLMEHIRLHKDQKPYKCDICLKHFVTSGRRSDHIKRKHMEKTECCLICNKMFSLKKELNRHVKKSHWHCDVPEFGGNINSTVNIEMLIPDNS